MIVSWLFCCAVSWGLAVVQLCLLFPGHIPISGTLKFLSLERARTMPSLMTAVGRWIALQAFVWQIQPVSIVHVLKKPYGGDQIDLALSIYLCFLFRCWKTEMGWHFYRCPWPTEPLNLYLPPINLEPRVHDVLSKQLKQPQGELEKEVNMKGNNDALCLHISRVGCGVLSAASHFHDFSHMAGDSSDVPASRHTVFRLSEANTDASLSFL